MIAAVATLLALAATPALAFDPSRYDNVGIPPPSSLPFPHPQSLDGRLLWPKLLRRCEFSRHGELAEDALVLLPGQLHRCHPDRFHYDLLRHRRPACAEPR
jgi:hypothetical protein